jgi:signal transduction histidine kinase/DNA-binding response OmpR family regulator
MAVPPPPRVLNTARPAGLRSARSAILRAAGFEVEEAEDGPRMLNAVARRLPDLILLENAPDGTGIQWCQKLKKDPVTTSIPIVSISEVAGDAGEAARILDGGSDAYLVEPVHPENLVATIRALLRFAHTERLSEALNRVNAAILSTLDFDRIMQRVAVEAAQEIDADSAGVILLEENEWVIKYTASLPRLVGMRFPDTPELEGSISARARGDAPFIVIGNTLLPPDVRAAMDRDSISAKLFVPLRVRGRLIGLIAFHYHSPREFEAVQVDFAAKLGSAVSLALENARLYTEAEEGRKMLEALMRHIPHGIAIADASGTVRMISSHGQTVSGLGRGLPGAIHCDIAPTSWRLFRPDSPTPPEHSDLPLARAIRDGAEVISEEWLLEIPGGERIPVLIDAGPIRDAEGTIIGGIFVWQDISTWKRLESELLHARKMDAISLLAGGLAHEFNNMLTVIAGHCQLLIENSRGSKIREHLTPVLDAAARLTSFTSELLGFAGRQIIRPAPVCLNGLIEQMKDPLQHLLGNAFDLSTTLEPDIGEVSADSGQIEHLIISLVLHARDSMPEGGSIRITTRKETVNGTKPSVCRVPPGEYVVLSIADTGPGIDAAAAERLFEPFYGAKPIGKGASLALSAIYGAVKQNRGDIRVSSEPGKGTRFDICLPRI